MYYFISLGYECSAAGGLRELGLRQEAYPFDWVESTQPAIRQCLMERFARFHKEVRLMDHERRVIDAYGIQYPHDYPVRSKEEKEKWVEEVGLVGEFGRDVMYMEEIGRPIVPEWSTYLDVVQEKYKRRIHRFLSAMEDRARPVIFFGRYHDEDARDFLRWLRTHYQREDFYMVNTGQPVSGKAVEGCITVNTERNGIWNETAVWREGLEGLLAAIQQ